jgi:replication-associated recombination protein RarA
MLFETFALPESDQLTDRFRPRHTSEFVGIPKLKRLAASLAAKPYNSYYIFRGNSGVGKTSFAVVMAGEIGAQVHHVRSQDCTVETLERIYKNCFYAPANGKRFHLILIDEADLMSVASRNSLLSMTDGTRPAPNTIIILTTNEAEKFEPRFASRFMEFNFSTQGMQKDAADFLATVWAAEAPVGATAPNFARIIKDSNTNIRAALMELQSELAIA